MICVPPSGGTGTSFASWVPLARPQLEIAGVQFPGRGIRLREPTIESMPLLIEAMGQAIGPALTEDYVILGYCLGGLIAYELVRWLERSPFRPPTRLIVCGCDPPSRDIGGELAGLTDAELIERLRGWGGTSDQALANPRIMAMTLPPLRSDLLLLENYHYVAEPRVTIPISAYYGSDDATMSTADIAAWHACTTGPFSARAVEGGHFPAPSVLVPALLEELVSYASRPP